MPHNMESPKMESVGQWARTVVSKKQNMVRSPSCKFNPLARKSSKQPCLNPPLKSPKCYVKITGSRYNGTFLLNIDDGLDEAIFHTMRDIEVALEEQAHPMGKPRVSPKNCLSSVFRCFGTSDLQTNAVCNKKKPPKSINKPAECSLTATIKKSDLGPLINAVQANSFNPSPENSSENVMRDVVDVFRTTLDQFRKENLSSFEVPSKQVSVKQSPSVSIGKAETDDITAKQLNEEIKRVAIIKFSQEEVLVIQPPKPSDNNTKELEVGIEVKPKSTASNVGQSIKLAKDKVLIGVQDGKGVLQINDMVPKRSLQMVIEEGVNGKPSMKLCVKEENPDQKEHPIQEQNHTERIKLQEHKEEYPKNYINHKYNESVSTITNSFENTVKNNIFRDNARHYKSVESQVSWARLKDINIHPSDKKRCISESTQYVDPASAQSSNSNHCVCCSVGTKPQTTVANVENEFSDVSQVTVLDSPCFKAPDMHKTRDIRINRLPYLVHKLYEPQSLYSSSAYFASDKPSAHYGLIGKAPISKRFETSKKPIKKPKSFSFSSDYSSSSKCTKIFRDISEIGVKGSEPLSKKDARMTASLVEDFEKVLRNMCGSSYLYHHSKSPEPKPSTGTEHHEQVLKIPKNVSSDNMSFDQWTQTENCTHDVRAGSVTSTKGRILKNRTAKMRESGDGFRSRNIIKKEKRTKSNISQRFAESSVSTSELDDGLPSDSSESKNHKLVFSMFAASDDNQLASTSMDENGIHGKAESFVGQKIFDAIEDHSNHAKLFGTIDKTESCVYQACKDASRMLLQEGKKMNVAVNMALYDGPSGQPLMDIAEEKLIEEKFMDEPARLTPYNEVTKSPQFGEAWNNNSSLDLMTCTGIRVKSKSCQNLSQTPRVSRSMENFEKGINRKRSQIKKLRYPQLTATDSHMSTLNVCGILNFNEVELKANDQSLVKNGKLNNRVENALPSAIRSLLLPRQRSLIFNNHGQLPMYCFDHLGSTNTTGYWDLGTSYRHEHDCSTSNEVYESAETVVMHRGLFKRTFFAMRSVRTVVTRKFSSIFRKLSFAHPDKKRKNSATSNSVVYVAIPLEKKSENLHLYPGIQ